MKKFKFTLQTVHKVRELNSERENLALNELQIEAEKAAARVAHLKAMRNEAAEKYLQKLNSGQYLNPLEMEMNANHFASLNAHQKEAQEAVDENRLACAQQIKVVKAARIEMKVTDKLRSDQQRYHQAEADRHEQHSIDEIVTTKFARHIQQAK